MGRDYMDQNEIEDMVNELEKVTKELDDIQKEIARDIASKITYMQNFIENMPESHEGFAPMSVPGEGGPREIILEKAVARITVRDNGETVFDGLF